MAKNKRIGKNVSIEGMDDIIKKFKHIATAVDEKDMENNLVEAAMVIRDAAKSMAPVKTGKLRESIVAKRYSRQPKGRPGAFVAIDYRIAPYAHNVEYGHGGPHPAPAHPFFRPAMDNNMGRVKKMIEAGAMEVIEKAARK